MDIQKTIFKKNLQCKPYFDEKALEENNAFFSWSQVAHFEKIHIDQKAGHFLLIDITFSFSVMRVVSLWHLTIQEAHIVISG